MSVAVAAQRVTVAEVLTEALDNLGLSVRELARLAAKDGLPSANSNRRTLHRWLAEDNPSPSPEVAGRFAPFLGEYGPQLMEAVREARARRPQRDDRLVELESRLEALERAFDERSRER